MSNLVSAGMAGLVHLRYSFLVVLLALAGCASQNSLNTLMYRGDMTVDSMLDVVIRECGLTPESPQECVSTSRITTEEKNLIGSRARVHLRFSQEALDLQEEAKQLAAEYKAAIAAGDEPATTLVEIEQKQQEARRRYARMTEIISNIYGLLRNRGVL